MEREEGTLYPHLEPKHLISSILPNAVLKLLNVSKNKNYCQKVKLILKWKLEKVAHGMTSSLKINS